MRFFLALAMITASFLAYSQTEQEDASRNQRQRHGCKPKSCTGATVYAVPEDISSFENIAPRSTTTHEAGEVRVSRRLGDTLIPAGMDIPLSKR